MKVTSEQELLFREQGYIRLPGALGKETVHPVKKHVLNELKRHNLWAQGKVLSKRIKGLPAFQQVNKLGQIVSYSGLSKQLIPVNLYVFMRRLSGTKLVSDQEAALLISLPHQGEWSLEGLNWHRDISEPESGKIPGIQLFFLLDNLQPHGGATLALSGSHRLRGEQRKKLNIEQILKGDASTSTVADISVVEMSGKMGDVYLMDMRVIHTPSINATKNVRLMATARFFAVNEAGYGT